MLIVYHFLKNIEALYKNQKAQIIVNGERTKLFHILREQDKVALSPLFILIIEILANKIRENPEIDGVKIKKDEHKVKLYADDMAIYLANPAEKNTNSIKSADDLWEISGIQNQQRKDKILITEPLERTASRDNTNFWIQGLN